MGIEPVSIPYRYKQNSLGISHGVLVLTRAFQSPIGTNKPYPHYLDNKTLVEFQSPIGTNKTKLLAFGE